MELQRRDFERTGVRGSARGVAAQLAEALQVDVESYEELRKERAAAIVSSKRGQVYRHAGGEKAEVTDLGAFQSAMAEGAVWVDELVEPKPMRANVESVAWSAGVAWSSLR